MSFNVGDTFEDELRITSYWKGRSSLGINVVGRKTGQHSFTMKEFMRVVANCDIRKNVILGRHRWRYYKQGSRIAIRLADDT